MKIQYSTNWMGPISTRWYENINAPYEMRETSGEILPKVEYKHFLESYSGGRIDIYGLDQEEYWGGKHEYNLPPMITEDWNALGEWLDQMQTETLWTYEKLIEHFQYYNKAEIRWAPTYKEKYEE